MDSWFLPPRKRLFQFQQPYRLALNFVRQLCRCAGLRQAQRWMLHCRSVLPSARRPRIGLLRRPVLGVLPGRARRRRLRLGRRPGQLVAGRPRPRPGGDRPDPAPVRERSGAATMQKGSSRNLHGRRKVDRCNLTSTAPNGFGTDVHGFPLRQQQAAEAAEIVQDATAGFNM